MAGDDARQHGGNNESQTPGKERRKPTSHGKTYIGHAFGSNLARYRQQHGSGSARVRYNMAERENQDHLRRKSQQSPISATPSVNRLSGTEIGKK